MLARVDDVALFHAISLPFCGLSGLSSMAARTFAAFSGSEFAIH